MRILAENTCCVVIDYQEKILPAMSEKEELLANSIKLLEGLAILNVPVMVTGQYTKGLGMNVPEIRAAAGTEIYFDKTSFSIYEDEAAKEALCGMKNSRGEQRKTVVICGIEAHVCVLQTVIDLKAAGYLPVLVEDCISSRKLHDKEIAVARARDEGAVITTCESLLFELTRAAGTDQFKLISKLVK